MRFILTVLLLLSCLLSPVALAQENTEAPAIDRSKLLVQPRNAEPVRFLDNPVLWMNEQQRSFYGTMSKSLRQLKTSSAPKAAITLMLISFLYGIFHAAGPGHGKVIVSAWHVANKSDLRRGMLIAFMSAMFQALTAITIVTVLMLLFSNAASLAKRSAGVLDTVSFAMITGVGLYVLWTAWREARGHGHHHHDHGPHHHHHDHHSHHHDDHQHGPHCNHAHAPAPADVRGDVSLWHMITLAFAVGLRPCTGAILVLVFAWTADLYWAGIASTVAMGVGVFLTVAAIATASVFARSWAMRLSAADNQRLARAGHILRWAGGIVITAMGALMFLGSLGPNAGMV
jgi:nickel/cobalt transporter (NicO) family protein